MCQKQHGAAFATYGSIQKANLVYIQGEELLKEFASSGSIKRKFCCRCGSNIEWSGSESYPDWASITLATLDSSYKPERISEIYIESKVCWLNEAID